MDGILEILLTPTVHDVLYTDLMLGSFSIAYFLFYDFILRITFHIIFNILRLLILFKLIAP